MGKKEASKARPGTAYPELEISEYLRSKDDIAAFLTAVLEEGDVSLFNRALGEVAKARGMAEVAKEIGVGRESLYKSLSAEGNPRFATIQETLGVLGFRLVVEQA